MRTLTVLNAHKILFSQKVQNYSKFHILDKSKNRDNHFFSTRFRLGNIFLPILNPSLIEKKIFPFESFEKRLSISKSYSVKENFRPDLKST